MIETKILISTDTYIRLNDQQKREGQIGLIVVGVLIVLLFLNGIRLRNKPENVAKRKEQKRLMKKNLNLRKLI